MAEIDWKMLAVKCARVFSPSAPVSARDLFAGRISQISRISEVVHIRGRHAIIYGDRGVGKTSLANILKPLLVDIHGVKVVKTNCAGSDTFESVWRKVLSEIKVIVEETPAPAVEGQPQPPHHHSEYRLSEWMVAYESIGPGEIGKLLGMVCDDQSDYVIVFDEFDRLPTEHRRMFADTIKDLADNSINATVVLVGVAQDVNDLIAEHQSIERNLTQIPMPPMNHDELGQILKTAMSKLGMSIDKKATDLIVALSNGYPHYTHVLGMESTRSAIGRNTLAINTIDTTAALQECIAQTEHSVRDEYYKASEGQRKGSLFPLVLLACAMTKPDMMGYFRSIDVKIPLNKIGGKEYDLPDYGSHLEKFSTDENRGPILERRGSTRLYRYKFRNPMLRPYIIMKGIQDKLISGSILENLSVLQPERVQTLFEGEEY